METKDHIMGHRSRLRQRYEKDGLNGFLPHEVLELLLFYTYPRRDTKVIAKKALSHFHNNLHKLVHASVSELKESGVSENSAVLIKLIRDAFLYQQKLSLIKSDFITSSNDVYNYCKNYFKGMQIEEFKVIFLNTANHILTEESLFQGTVNESRVYIRKILERCLNHSASQVLLVHNHPTGNLKPSESDLAITNKIKEALALYEIRILDHLIIGDNDFYSFKENGFL